MGVSDGCFFLCCCTSMMSQIDQVSVQINDLLHATTPSIPAWTEPDEGTVSVEESTIHQLDLHLRKVIIFSTINSSIFACHEPMFDPYIVSALRLLG